MKRYLFFLILLFCGPPKPDSMPEPLNIYTQYTKEEIQSMLKSDNWQDRSSAVLHIQQNRYIEFSNQLLELLKNDPSPNVRQIAALTLSDFQNLSAIPYLISLLKNPVVSGQPIEKKIIIESLGKYKQFTTIKEILPYLEEDDLTIRLTVVKSIETAEPLLKDFQKKEAGKMILHLALKNQNQDKARTYVMALGRIRYKAAENYLISLIENKDSLENTKAAAILALGKIQSKKSVPILIRYLVKYPEKTSENAFYALKEIKDPTSISMLFNLIDEYHNEVRYLAVDILSEIPSENVGVLALKKLEEKKNNTIAPLSLLLGKIKYNKASKLIREILREKTSPEREIIAQSLGWMGDRENVPHLIEVLQENEGEGRYGAAWSLGILEASESLPYLIKTSQSKDKKLAILSIQALGHLKSKESITVLRELANRSDLQIYAMDSLSEIDDPKVLQILKEFALSSNAEKSKYAIELIGKIKKQESVDALIDILRKTSTEDLKIKLIYSSLQQLTTKDFRTKNQWLQWYELENKPK